MSGQQQFERLIRLEDEELGSNEDIENYTSEHNNDSCHVPMISGNINNNHNNSLENLFPPMKHKHIGGGFTFTTINGSHIHINPEQLKYISLIALTVQNAALNLTMRAATTQKEQFSVPIAVTVAEILKLVTCLVIITFEEMSISKAVNSIKSHILHNYLDTLKVMVPSFLYYIQNNLLYVGSTHLDAATSQVTYQLKILTTAIFSVLMLNKRLTKIQWASLVILFIGVALIEAIKVNDHNSNHKQSDLLNSNTNNTITIHESGQGKTRHEQPLLGFLAILIACCLSGLAGVYFEKILKSTSHISLWIRNIQLAAATIPIGLIQVFILNREYLQNNGLFHGFTPLTWICIMLQVQGGLLVAVVVKFANNILKGFATSLAIVISTVASIILFDFNLTPSFLIGSLMVVGSVMMYNKQ